MTIREMMKPIFQGPFTSTSQWLWEEEICNFFFCHLSDQGIWHVGRWRSTNWARNFFDRSWLRNFTHFIRREITWLPSWEGSHIPSQATFEFMSFFPKVGYVIVPWRVMNLLNIYQCHTPMIWPLWPCALICQWHGSEIFQMVSWVDINPHVPSSHFVKFFLKQPSGSFKLKNLSRLAFWGVPSFMTHVHPDIPAKDALSCLTSRQDHDKSEGGLGNAGLTKSLISMLGLVDLPNRFNEGRFEHLRSECQGNSALKPWKLSKP